VHRGRQAQRRPVDLQSASGLLGDAAGDVEAEAGGAGAAAAASASSAPSAALRLLTGKHQIKSL